MGRIVYVNGNFIQEEEAMVSIFDRGFLMGDSVYEVSSVLNGRLVDNASHLARLERSLGQLEIALPVSLSKLVEIQEKMVELNDLKEGALYLQITRGVADRDFAFPKNLTATMIMFTQSKNLLNSKVAAEGLSVQTVSDQRWKRRDIKTTQLLAASMAKESALRAGYNDVWLVEEGYVTEASSSNVYIITKDNTLLTQPVSNQILRGITREAILKIGREENLEIQERAFTVEEVYVAKEAFSTSATSFVFPVIKVDGININDGKPGAITQKLRQIYIEMALKS